MVVGYIRLDPRLHKKLSKVADKHELYLRDFVNFILEETEEQWETYADGLDQLIEEEDS